MNAVIRTPTVPNFLTVTVAGKEVQVSVADVSEADLKAVGAAWTEKLIETAKSYRKARDERGKGGR